MANKCFGSFDNLESVISNFKGYGDNAQLKEPVPSEDELLFASYGGASYEGDATVIFRKDGKLYEVHGSHCSCHGLEDQWEPEETTLEALSLRGKKDPNESYGWHFLRDHDEAAYQAYWNLVEELTPLHDGSTIDRAVEQVVLAEKRSQQ